jgi:hypothetical protein
MTRWIAAVLTVVSLAGASQARAQEIAAGPGRVEISIIPGGFYLLTRDTSSAQPSFGSYGLGGAFGVNVNRFVAIEGELAGALGVSQSLDFGGSTLERTTPHMLNYGANLVVSAANRSAVVPYVAGGIGGLSLFETADVGITRTETFLTANVGGGVKWHTGLWGLRADYRFVGVKSKEDAPAFFGTGTRYGHRVYGGVILNLVR